MRLKEFTDNVDKNAVYNPKDDRKNRRHYDDTRKPKLTLKHINKLRKMREARKLDMAEREKFWGDMYGIPPAEEGPEF